VTIDKGRRATLNRLSPDKRALLEQWMRGDVGAGVEDSRRRIPRRPEEGPAPLSYGQQRLWLLDRLVPGSAAYNMPGGMRLRGPLDVQALERALGEIISRHEALRTTFEVRDGDPVQVVHPPAAFTLPVIDVSSLPEEQRVVRVRRIRDDAAQEPFDLEKGPLVRTVLVRQGADDHVFLVTMHHIVTDGWSANIFLRELKVLYEAFSQGRPAPLKDLPIQYADYACWQRHRLESGALDGQMAYWKERLGGELPVLDLPTDHPRPPMQSFRGGALTRLFPAELARGLNSLARETGATLFMTLLAAFQVLLHRYSGQRDVIVGSPIANRDLPELEALIGFFVNTLALKTDLGGDPTFQELLGRVRGVLLDAYANRDLPFEKLVSELHPERDMSHNPLFQVMFVLQNTGYDGAGFAGLERSPMRSFTGTAKFDLWLSIREGSRGLHATLEYSSDLFEEATAARLLGHYRTLLEGIVADADRRLSELPLLTPGEHAGLAACNDTEVDYPGAERLLHELIEEQVDRTPDAVAVVFGEERLTYGELDARSNRLARYLRRLGVGPDVPVGVCAERSVELVVALLGILKAGGAYVPLDSEYPAERLAFMLEDSGVKVLLTQERLAEALPPHQTRVIRLEGDWEAVSRESAARPQGGATNQNLAYIIYTSGSTGRPKGAMNSHRGIVNRLLWMQEAYGLDATDRVLQKTPFSFDVSVWEFFWPLLTGAALVLAEPGGHKDAAYLVELIRNEGITTMHFVPSMLQAFLEEAGLEECDSLRRVICSGEALPPQAVKRFYARLGGSGGELHNLYGPTEAAVDVTWWPCSREGTPRVVPIGRPIANTQIHILDSRLNPVPIGVPGELYIGGVQLARGYWNRPGLTAGTFVPDPFGKAPGARLYWTGDRARRLADGNIEFLGRIDHQVKLRGYRIELGEIEATLQGHEGVREAVVLSREDVPGRQRLVAYVVPDPALRQRAGEGGPASEQVKQWRQVFDDTYGGPGWNGERDAGAGPEPAVGMDASDGPESNFVGWNSSYTGHPIPVEEMEEWVEGTCRRILELGPRRVLEIGCGTGLLLFRIAPRCEQYLAMDFSSRALEYVRQWLTQPGRVLPQVHLEQRTADDLAWVEAESVDVVVLNSVIQYFPNVDYLNRVLDGAVRAVRPGGHIFIGDVRSLPLQKTFHTSVELYRSPYLVTADWLRGRVEGRLAQENELVLDPRFFYAAASRWPRVDQAVALLKRGRSDNELSRFRYDVILRLGPGNPAPAVVEWTDWRGAGLTLDRVRRILRDEGPGLWAVSGVPDARLAGELEAQRALEVAPRTQTVGELLEGLQLGGAAAGTSDAVSAVHPEELWQSAEVAGYDVDLTWAEPGADGGFHAVFRRRPKGPREDAAPPRWVTAPAAVPAEEDESEPWANDPLQARLERWLLPELGRYLKERLPEYMVPGSFVLLGSLPLLPNGKVDRRSLPPPFLGVANPEEEFVSPRGAVEETLAGIWAGVLGVDRVSARANFFELGGDSIAGVQVVARANQAGLPLTTRQIFQHQTVAELARALAEADIAPAGGLGEGQAASGTGLSPEVRHDFPLAGMDAEQLARLVGEGSAIEDAYPLTGLQDNALRSKLNHPAGGALYCFDSMYNVYGELDPEAFRRAWQWVADRHPVMRTSFIWEGVERPLQLVHRSLKVRLDYRDWAGLEPSEQRDRLQEHFQESRRTGHALDSPAQWSVALFRTGPESHFLYESFNYMLRDGWSFPLVFKEAFSLYEALRCGRDLDLPEVRPFRDHIAWLQRQDMGRAEAFWRRFLEGFSGPTPLVPGSEGRAVTGRGEYRNYAFTLARRTTVSLAALARGLRLTLSTLVQAAWGLVVARYSGRDDIVFGLVLSGRPATLAGVEHMVGQFNNFLPLRMRVASDARLIPWLEDIQRTVAEMREYEYTPLGRIQCWVGPGPEVPLFQSHLVYENFPTDPTIPGTVSMRQLLSRGDQAALPGGGVSLRMDTRGGIMQTEHPLRVVVLPAESLVVQLSHYSELLPESMVAAMAADFEAVLEEMARGGNKRVHSLFEVMGS